MRCELEQHLVEAAQLGAAGCAIGGPGRRMPGEQAALKLCACNGSDSALDRVGRDQPVQEAGPRLAKPVHAAHGLQLERGLDERVEEEHVISARDVEALGAAAEGHE